MSKETDYSTLNIKSGSYSSKFFGLFLIGILTLSLFSFGDNTYAFYDEDTVIPLTIPNEKPEKETTIKSDYEVYLSETISASYKKSN